jgi:hypothetical protein
MSKIVWGSQIFQVHSALSDGFENIILQAMIYISPSLIIIIIIIVISVLME